MEDYEAGGRVKRPFLKKELKKVYARLESGDRTALAPWREYVEFVSGCSAGKAVNKAYGRWHEDLFDERFGDGLAVGLELGEDILAGKLKITGHPENYLWPAVKHGIDKQDKKDRRFLKNHKSTDYQDVKTELNAKPLKMKSKFRKGCADEFEDKVIRLLEIYKSDEKVAKLIGRMTHVVRAIRHIVEERKLRQGRTVFFIARPETIEPVASDSIPRINVELEEVLAGCNDQDRELIETILKDNELTLEQIATELGMPLWEAKRRLGAIAEKLAKRKQKLGEPDPLLEKRAKSLKAARKPSPKKPPKWPADKPHVRKGKPVKV